MKPKLMFSEDVRKLLTRKIEYFGSQKAAAAFYGVSESQLTEVLLHERQPGPKLLKALGLKKVTAFTT